MIKRYVPMYPDRRCTAQDQLAGGYCGNCLRYLKCWHPPLNLR